MLTDTQKKLRADVIKTALEYGYTSLNPDAEQDLHSPPGKFEGEPYYALFFYEQALNECADEPLYDGATQVADIMEISDDERAAFALGDETSFVALWYSDQGFVTLEELTPEERDALQADYERKRIWCDDCNMLSINGVACHETGCPSNGARWDADSGEWVHQRKCRECGQTVDADDPCCSAEQE